MEGQNVEKFYVDFDGSITIVLPNSSKKIKLASVVNMDTNFMLWTIGEEELKYQLDNVFAGF